MIEQEEKEILEKAERIKKEKAEAKKKAYNREYIKNKTVNKGIQLNKELDNDIITFINDLDQPFNKYIKELIRKDIKNHE